MDFWDVTSPELSSVQVIVSSLVSSRLIRTVSMVVHSLKNSFRRFWFRLWAISLNQLPFRIASLTVVFFRLLCLYKGGHRLAGGLPSIQLEFQKEALSPFLTVTTVAALKSAISSASTGSSEPFHGRSRLDHRNQSHIICKALLNLLNSMIPRPPYSTGLATDVHATLRFPPVSSLSPA
jgi:hypothetical protein